MLLSVGGQVLGSCSGKKAMARTCSKTAVLYSTVHHLAALPGGAVLGSPAVPHRGVEAGPARPIRVRVVLRPLTIAVKYCFGYLSSKCFSKQTATDTCLKSRTSSLVMAGK